MVGFQPQFGHEDDGLREEIVSAEGTVDPRVEEAHREIAWVEELTKTKGWSIVCAFIEDQCKRRMNMVMTEPTAHTPEEAAKLNFTRGEWNGMQLIPAFVKEQQEAASGLLEMFKE